MFRKASRVRVLAGVLAGLLVAMLAACGGGRERGPAWPKLHEPEADGGESLEPRHASSVAAIEKAEDATPAEAAPASAGAAAASAPAAPPDDAAPEVPSTEDPEVFTTEEIVIEIEED